MSLIPATRLGLRVVGIGVGGWALVTVWGWLSPILTELLEGNWEFARNMAPAPFRLELNNTLWPKAGFVVKAAAGIYLLFFNRGLARLLCAGLGGACPRCGYALRGLPEGTVRCPECGEEIR